MLFGTRHRTSAHPAAAAAASTGTTPTPVSCPEDTRSSAFLLQQDGDNDRIIQQREQGFENSIHNDDDGKTHKPLPWRLRVRAVTARVAVWGGRAVLAIAAWCCLFAWARLCAMRSVVSLASARTTTQRLPKFTVLVNTFKRPVQLEGAIRHYAACDG